MAGSPMADWVDAGQTAPAFHLVTDQGKKVRLSNYRGQPVVLYFYPRDDTPGCTREACAFRDAQQQMNALGAKVIGISTDDSALRRSTNQARFV